MLIELSKNESYHFVNVLNSICIYVLFQQIFFDLQFSQQLRPRLYTKKVFETVLTRVFMFVPQIICLFARVHNEKLK